MVTAYVLQKQPFSYRMRSDVFPTPRSPTMTILKLALVLELIVVEERLFMLQLFKVIILGRRTKIK